MCGRPLACKDFGGALGGLQSCVRLGAVCMTAGLDGLRGSVPIMGARHGRAWPARHSRLILDGAVRDA